MPRIMNRLGWSISGAVALGLLAALAGVIYAGPLDPPKPPAPTQANLIFQPATGCAGFPISLAATGAYRLAENIVMPGACAKDGIVISADNVTLDLGGFTVTGIPGALSGIRANPGTRGLVIMSGQVAKWPADGVSIAVDSTATGLVVLDSGGRGIVADEVSVIRNNTVRGSGAAGIYVSGIGSLVEGNHVAYNASVASGAPDVGGIVAAAGIASDRPTLIRNNEVSNTLNGKSGIVLSNAFNASVVANNASFNSGAGVLVASGENIIDGNTVAFNSVAGVQVTGDANIVTHNAANSNFVSGVAGFWVTGTNNTITANVARFNAPTNYSIAGGNDLGPIGTAAASTSPWANISD